MKRLVCLLLCLLLPFAALAEVHVIMDEGVDVYEENGIGLAVLDARFPQLVGMEDEAVMDRVNKAIQDLIRLNGGYDEGIASAIEARDAGMVDFTERTYSLSVRAEEKLHSEGMLLSVLYTFAAYTGGAHENQWTAVQHYNLQTGDVVSLPEMLTDESAFHAAVGEMLLAQIGVRGLAQEIGYFEGYEDTVRAWRMDQAILTSEGLTVYFDPYEIGPYAAGIQEIALDYALVAPYLTHECRAWLAL